MRKQIEKALTILVVFIAVSGIGLHIYSRVQDTVPPPSFSFDKDQAPGWWGRDNVNVQKVAQSGNYTGETPIDELPVADVTIFQGESVSDRPEQGCFVSYSYYDFQLEDIEAAYDNYFSRKHTDAGKLDTFEPVKHSIDTYEGKKEYDLHQFRFVLEGQDTLQGYQVGFIPLSSGYIRTEGICKTYEDLAFTKPILSTIELLER